MGRREGGGEREREKEKGKLRGRDKHTERKSGANRGR